MSLEWLQELSRNECVPPAAAHVTTKRVVEFALGGERYAIGADTVREIVTGAVMTSLPAASARLSGMMALRGEWIPVLHLAHWLNPGSARQPGSTTTLVLDQVANLMAINVDHVLGIQDVALSDLMDLPRTYAHGDAQRFSHVYSSDGHPVAIINPDQLWEVFPMNVSNAVSRILGRHKEEHVDMTQLLGFVVGQTRMAVDISEVSEIIKLQPISHVPRAPKFIEGVINLRGEVVPAIDLRTRFNLPRIAYDRATRMLIIQVDDKRVGLIVDAVTGILRAPAASLKRPPVEAVGEDAFFVKSMLELDHQLFIVLDLMQILSHQEIHDVQSLQASLSESADRIIPI